MGAVIVYNPYERKMTQKELEDFLINEQPEIIIAGTETYSNEIIKLCPNLKYISRVGIGVDSIDFDACKHLGIKVGNTPDAPTNAVAELIIGQILILARKINKSDHGVRNKKWVRYIGREVKYCNVGIIGCGRIGSSVLKKIKSFEPNNIFIHDIDESKALSQCDELKNIFLSSKEQILKECDIISIHIPLNDKNKNFISYSELNIMKKNCIIINSSRGGIINEKHLYEWLKKNQEASAAIDVFDIEPYVGELTSLENVLLTPHLGSCSKESRTDMENESIENVINFLNNNE